MLNQQKMDENNVDYEEFSEVVDFSLVRFNNPVVVEKSEIKVK